MGKPIQMPMQSLWFSGERATKLSMTENCEMNILYQFNDKYAPYACVSMTSLFENNKAAQAICVYILGEELSEESVRRLKSLAGNYGRRLVFVDTKELVEKMKSLGMPTYRGSYAANMRLFVDYLFEEGKGKCADDGSLETADKCGEFEGENRPSRLLYLDADTIVTGSLEKLFGNEDDSIVTEGPEKLFGNDADTINMDETGRIVDASANNYGTKIKTLGMVYDTLSNFHKYSIGLSEKDGYYNSGVILIDVDKWIEGRFSEKIVDHVKNVRAQYPSPDQDLINIVLQGEITTLPFEYNFQPHLRDYSYSAFTGRFKPAPFYSKAEVESANSKPVILHAFRYLGEFPWHKGNCHPFNDEFDKYLALSSWSDYEKKDSGAGFVMKTEQILYHILPKGMFLAIFKIMHGRFYKKADKMSKKSMISSRM